MEISRKTIRKMLEISEAEFPWESDETAYLGKKSTKLKSRCRRNKGKIEI